MVDTADVKNGSERVGTQPAGWFTRLADWAALVSPTHVGLFAGVVIAVLVVLGTLQRTLYPQWGAANLDSEMSVGTWVAATLLWAAAVLWILVAALERRPRMPIFAWGALLVLLALDEGNAFHEALERGTGVDWQIIYLPILVIGGTLWLLLVRRYAPSTTATLLVAGAGAWGITLILELVQNWGGSPIEAAFYNPAMIAEEALEMVGSTLIVVAGLIELRQLQR